MLAAPASPLPPELLVELPLELPLLLLLPDPLELPLVLLPPEPLVELPPELPLLLLPPEPPVELPPELPLLLPPEVLPPPDPESPSDEAATTSSMLASPSPPLSAERPQLRERVTAVDRVKTPRPVIFIFIEHPSPAVGGSKPSASLDLPPLMENCRTSSCPLPEICTTRS
ncbi:MAG: hypothetical protein M3O46_01930 [Myxococcota bacterium]|nr:hypothetical protein [Myxococcota bacterium]